MPYSAGECPNLVPLHAGPALSTSFCLAFVLLALVVAVSGGFRVRVFDARLAVTSPYRMLLWAAMFARRPSCRPSAASDLRRPLRANSVGMEHERVRTALVAVVSTRAAIMFVGHMAIFLIGYPNVRAPWRVSDNEFGNLPARWDVGWYLGVAIDGYSFSPQVQANAGQQNIVFFPAMPLLIRVAGRLFGGSPLAYTWGGVVVSLFAFLAGLAYLFRLARDLLASEIIAAYVVWLVAAYPFALFYGVPSPNRFFSWVRPALSIISIAVSSGRAERGDCSSASRGRTDVFCRYRLALIALEPWLPAWLVGESVRRIQRAPGSERRRGCSRHSPPLRCPVSPCCSIPPTSGPSRAIHSAGPKAISHGAAVIRACGFSSPSDTSI